MYRLTAKERYIYIYIATNISKDIPNLGKINKI